MSFSILTESGDSLVTEQGDSLVTEDAVPDPCSPDTLLANAACFTCLPRGFFMPLKLALLAQWLKAAGGADYTTGNIDGLIADAQCFSCVPAGQQMLIKLALLCNIATLNQAFFFASSSDSPSTASGTDIIIDPG